MHRGAARFLVVIILGGASGCSTLAVTEIYVAQETGKAEAGNAGPDAEVRLAFDDDVKFGSVGVLGMPVLPVYAGVGPHKELSLQVRLRLDHRVNYSFAASPCLDTATGPLCPELISIAPEFSSADGNAVDGLGRPTGARIQMLSRRSVEYSPAKLGADARVSAADIEKDCLYDGNPPWVSGHVNAIYTYRCADKCPAEIVVNSDGIVIAGDEFRSQGSYHFARKKVADYEGLTAIQ